MSAPNMPMMNEDGLLECPFCGGRAYTQKLTGGSSTGGFSIACKDCGCGTDSWLKLESTVKAWNTRNGNLYTPQDFKDAAFERENSDIIDGRAI